ncbi:MAG: serine/threonine-protein kinase [Planctomycetota bacterium]
MTDSEQSVPENSIILPLSSCDLSDIAFLKESFKAGKRFSLESFLLLKIVGKGSQAVVFKAKDRKEKSVVALKILNPKNKDIAQIERFIKEARLLIRVNHPNIAKGYRFGYMDGFHYFAMEYLKGFSAQRFLEKHSKMTLDQVLLVAEKIAEALNYVHSMQWIHRDIKPENIMILRSFQEIKLCDLGLAKGLKGDKDLTQIGKFVGTPNFISPEIAQGQKNDIRSDIYSLGASLYYLSTGQLPFTGETSVEVMRKHVLEELIPPTERDPEVDLGLSELILNMMAKNPLERPQNPENLLSKIDRIKKGKSPFDLDNFDKSDPDYSALLAIPTSELEELQHESKKLLEELSKIPKPATSSELEFLESDPLQDLKPQEKELSQKDKNRAEPQSILLETKESKTEKKEEKKEDESLPKIQEKKQTDLKPRSRRLPQKTSNRKILWLLLVLIGTPFGILVLYYLAEFVT